MKPIGNGCERYRESLCLRAAGALSGPQTAEVESHLAACAGCRQFFNEIKQVTEPLADWERGFAHIEPDFAARQRWAKAIHSAAAPQPDRRPAARNLFARGWTELFWNARRVWAGFAVVWAVIIVANLADPDVSQPALAKTDAPPANLFLAWEKQQRLLADLMATAEPREADKPKPAPRPHSRREPGWQLG